VHRSWIRDSPIRDQSLGRGGGIRTTTRRPGSRPYPCRARPRPGSRDAHPHREEGVGQASARQHVEGPALDLAEGEVPMADPWALPWTIGAAPGARATASWSAGCGRVGSRALGTAPPGTMSPAASQSRIGPAPAPATSPTPPSSTPLPSGNRPMGSFSTPRQASPGAQPSCSRMVPFTPSHTSPSVAAGR
jgi:hypothetical protein